MPLATMASSEIGRLFEGKLRLFPKEHPIKQWCPVLRFADYGLEVNLNVVDHHGTLPCQFILSR